MALRLPYDKSLGIAGVIWMNCKEKKVKLTRILFVAALLAAIALPVLADDVVYDTVYLDPATLHVGNPPAGGDPNLIGTTFGIYQNSGGAGTLNDPWLLILGVPNVSNAATFSNASISSISGGGTSNYLGLGGTMTSGQEAYSALHLQGPTDNSNSFVNWSAAETTLAGINATSFGLYEFAITANLPASGNVQFSFASLPTGTIAIAYGQTGQTSSSQTCTTKNGKTTCKTTVTNTIMIYDTPFTEAGFRTPPPPPPSTPEPASMVLLGAGILGLGSLKKIRN
jgi:hypothetical protein